MKFYRNQPQADSHIYRSVFIEYIQEKSAAEKTSFDDKDQANAKSNAAEPEVVSGRNTIYGTESRGDIIYFYNKTFVPKMQQFAMRFSTSSSQVSFCFPFRHALATMNHCKIPYVSEQFAAVAPAKRPTIDLTQKNLTLS